MGQWVLINEDAYNHSRVIENQSHLLIQVQRRIAKLIAMAPIGRPRSLLRNETGRTVLVIGLQQPVNLTSAESKRHAILDDAQALVTDLLNDFEAMQLLL